jgi:cytochrome P450
MGLRRNITFPMFGDGIFNQDGEPWKHSRELLRPHFHFKEYSNLQVFKEATDNLLDKIPAEGGVLDLQPLFFCSTLDATTAFLFGESIDSFKAGDSSDGRLTFADAFNIAQEYIAIRFRLFGLYWLIRGKNFRDACNQMHCFADQIIDRNLSKKTEDNVNKYVFLRAMAEKTSDKLALRSQIINVLTAGRDTTACLLSWTLYVGHRQVKLKKSLGLSF